MSADTTPDAPIRTVCSPQWSAAWKKAAAAADNIQKIT